MTTLNAHLIGRTGNQMFQYCYARALAERLGPDCELRTNPWPGQQIFEGVNEGPLTTDGIRLVDGYRQCQRDLIYTRADARRWFKLKPEFQSWVNENCGQCALAHRRVGDYASCGYVVVSEQSYIKADCTGGWALEFVTEESPLVDDSLPFPWLADFLRLMYAPILMRGNSSFSWWAAVLNPYKIIYSPVIEGFSGGREHDCPFVPGNYPRMCNLNGFTDLHLPE